jgi:anti-sigma factor RsiW
MKAETNTLNCGRENDLIGFLYGELDATETLRFSRHMQDCAGCNSQLASFTYIRESVVEWRNESLGALTSVAGNPPPVRIDQRRPSALAALREFFNLSPLWMKGTVAFASVLFCLYAVLAIARFSEPSNGINVASNGSGNAASAQEFNAQVERRVQQELERREASQKGATTAVNAAPSVLDSPKRIGKGKNQLAAASPQRKAARPLSKLERQELAADLRLIAESGDGELVLIGDRINQ